MRQEKKEQTRAAEVGARLRRIREHNGWSQKELADRLGVTAPQLSRWENGKILPDTDSQVDICDGVFTSLDELIRGIGQVRGKLAVDVDLRELCRSIEQLDVHYRKHAAETLRAILAQAHQDAGTTRLTAPTPASAGSPPAPARVRRS